MALWQIDFFVLPKTSIDPNVKFELSGEYNFDDAFFWEPLKVNLNFFNNMANILPKGKSWSKNIILYGEENSNRLEVFLENNIIVSVSLRIDFTSNYENILVELIEFFILNGLIVLDNRLNILPLNFEGIKGVIENSPQVKLYKNLSNE